MIYFFKKFYDNVNEIIVPKPIHIHLKLKHKLINQYDKENKYSRTSI